MVKNPIIQESELENQTEVNELVQTDEIEQEPVQVAANIPKVSRGIGKVVSDYFMGEETIVPPNVRKQRESQLENIDESIEAPLVTSDKGELFIRPATMEELEAFKDYKEKDIKFLKSRQFFEDDKGNFNIIRPNLSKITGPKTVDVVDETTGKSKKVRSEEPVVQLQKMLATMFEQFKDESVGGKKILQKGDRGFKQIIKEAGHLNSSKVFLDLLQRKPGERLFTDAETLAARKLTLNMTFVANQALEKALETGKMIDMAKAAQLISLSGFAEMQVVGLQEGAGRLLATNRILAGPTKERAFAVREMMEKFNVASTPAVISEENLQEFVKAYGGADALKQYLHFYARLPEDFMKRNFAKKSIMRRSMDMGAEIYQSALIGNPITHSFNFVGQGVMMETLVMERFLEGRAKEAFAMLVAQPKYFGQALRAGFSALRYEQAIADKYSKFDMDQRSVSRHGAGLRNREEGGGRIESAAAMFFDGFGVMMRAYGFRPMLATDEFYKSLGRGMQIEALATRAKGDAYTIAIDAGDTKDVAKEKALKAYFETKESEAVFDQSAEFARMLTFQDDLPASFQNMGKYFNHPIAKIWLPFYKTPSQIVRRITERTPLSVVMPSVRDKIINGSSSERREALARIGFSTGIGATLIYGSKGGFSEDFVFTGYGPTNKNERRRWLENNQPYSIGVKVTRTNEFGETRDEWKWTSYTRYDPISGVLAMAADTAYVLNNSDDDVGNVQILFNMGIATSKYVTTSLPMLQFLGELIDLVGTQYEDGDTKNMRIVELFSKQVASAGLVVGQQVASVGLLPQGTSAVVERYVDPVVRDARSPNQYPMPEFGGIVQSSMRGVYDALNHAKSRNFFLSGELPKKLNRWGEEIVAGNGTLWETWSPFKVIYKPQANLINTTLEELGFGLVNLSRGMGESKIRLNGEQYKRYIELYNNPGSSKVEPDNIPSVLEEMEEVILSFENFPELTTNQKIEKIKEVDNAYKGAAKSLMLLEFPELQALITQRDEYKLIKGENPLSLTPPSESEIRDAMEQMEIY